MSPFSSSSSVAEQNKEPICSRRLEGMSVRGQRRNNVEILIFFDVASELLTDGIFEQQSGARRQLPLLNISRLC